MTENANTINLKLGDVIESQEEGDIVVIAVKSDKTKTAPIAVLTDVSDEPQIYRNRHTEHKVATSEGSE